MASQKDLPTIGIGFNRRRSGKRNEVYATVKNMDAISRGAALLKSQGFLKAFMPALDANWAAVEGLTPGAWMLIGGIAEAVDQFFLGEE